MQTLFSLPQLPRWFSVCLSHQTGTTPFIFSLQQHINALSSRIQEIFCKWLAGQWYRQTIIYLTRAASLITENVTFYSHFINRLLNLKIYYDSNARLPGVVITLSLDMTLSALAAIVKTKVFIGSSLSLLHDQSFSSCFVRQFLFFVYKIQDMSLARHLQMGQC